MEQGKSKNAIIFFGFLYLFLPLVNINITQDPEITLRFLVWSVLLLIVITGLLLSGIQLNRNLILHPVFLTFTVYFIISLLSLWNTINRGDGIYDLTRLFIILVSFVIMVTLLRKDNVNSEKIPLLATVSSLLFVLFGLLQLIKLVASNPGQLFGIDVYSTLSNKNFFAETLLLNLPFVTWTYIYEKKFMKIVAGITIILSIFLIVLIQSAAVYLASAATLFLAAVILFFNRNLFFESAHQKKIFTRIILSFTTFVCGALLFAFITSGNFNNSFSRKMNAMKLYVSAPEKIFDLDAANDNSLYDRLFLARNSLKMAKEHPIAGTGINNWRILLPAYGLYGTTIMSTGHIRWEHPHNDFLFVLCETGIPGLLAWIGIFVFAFIAIKRMMKSESQNGKNKFLYFMMLLVLISFLFLSMFSYPKERFYSVMILVVALSIIVASDISQKEKKPVHSKFILIGLLLLLTFGTYVQASRYRSQVFLMRGLAYQKQSRFPAMETMVNKSISPFQVLDLSGTPIQWYLAQSMYYQGKTDSAFSHYLQAEVHNPYHMQVLNDLGAQYESRGDHKKAMEYFSRVFAINSDFQDSKWNLVAVYYNSGQIEKAYELIKTLYPRFTDKWRSQLNTILIKKAQNLVQSRHDTSLAESLNKALINRQYYLIDVFIKSEKTGNTFENQLLKEKK